MTQAHNSYQVVYGLGKEDDSYGWISVRPPVSDQVFDSFELEARHAYSDKKCIVTSRVAGDELEICLQQINSIPENEMLLFAQYFVQLIHESDRANSFLDTFCVPVDGPESIFEQRNTARRQNDPIDSHQSVAYC